jgi:PhnB protein
LHKREYRSGKIVQADFFQPLPIDAINPKPDAIQPLKTEFIKPFLRQKFKRQKTGTMSKKNSIKLDIYVNYPGNCEEAFRFYEQQLGGKITMMMTHQQQPDTSAIPKNWGNAILHARIEIGDTILMGADIPNAEPMRSAYLTLRLGSIEEAERVYVLLSTDGQIFMKMEKTFFASRFAMLRDKFGTSWMLLCEN